MIYSILEKQVVHYKQGRCEHKRSVRDNKVEQSALAEHVQQTGHAISWENMRPAIKENRGCQRRWNEACMIFKTKNVIVNRDCGTS